MPANPHAQMPIRIAGSGLAAGGALAYASDPKETSCDFIIDLELAANRPRKVIQADR
jgi:hypothetical protein